MMQSNGNVKIASPPVVKNLYYGQIETGTSRMWLHYDYKTDIFKDYGFDTCLALQPNVANNDDSHWAYSYFAIQPDKYEADSVYVYSMYFYNVSDGPFQIHVEHGGDLIQSNASLYNDGSFMFTDDSVKSQVRWHWCKIKTPSDEKSPDVMLYPSPGTKHNFTTDSGMQYVAGITIYKGWDLTGTSDVFLPFGSKKQLSPAGGFMQNPDFIKFNDNKNIFNSYIEI